MDEPFAALDEFTRFKLNKDLLHLWRESNFTVVLRHAFGVSNRSFSPNSGSWIDCDGVNHDRWPPKQFKHPAAASL